MTTTKSSRFRAWLLDLFTYESEDSAVGAIADATRWGWLPALSGVTAGAAHARSVHAAAQQGTTAAGG